MRDCGFEVGHSQERVRRRLEPHELHVRGWRLRLVELDVPESPAPERLERNAGPEVAAFGQGDRVSGLQQPQHECRRRAASRGIEEAVAAVELADCALRLDHRRIRIPRVVVRARLTVLVRPDRRPVDGTVHVTTLRGQSPVAGAGRRSSSRPIRASEGKSFVHDAAMPIIATPPATTAGTVPIRRATAPDSNAPSSFDALMNTHSTAFTRPSNCCGVRSVTAVERMLTLIMSTKPVRPSIASDSGSDFESPKPIIPTPKIATTASIVGPAGVRSGRRVRRTAAASAPTEGAVRSSPSPTGPVWRIERANTGASAIASPSRTLTRSRPIAPRSMR